MPVRPRRRPPAAGPMRWDARRPREPGSWVSRVPDKIASRSRGCLACGGNGPRCVGAAVSRWLVPCPGPSYLMQGGRKEARVATLSSTEAALHQSPPRPTQAPNAISVGAPLQLESYLFPPSSTLLSPAAAVSGTVAPHVGWPCCSGSQMLQEHHGRVRPGFPPGWPASVLRHPEICLLACLWLVRRRSNSP
jgi:hypothetical protein